MRAIVSCLRHADQEPAAKRGAATLASQPSAASQDSHVEASVYVPSSVPASAASPALPALPPGHHYEGTEVVRDGYHIDYGGRHLNDGWRWDPDLQECVEDNPRAGDGETQQSGAAGDTELDTGAQDAQEPPPEIGSDAERAIGGTPDDWLPNEWLACCILGPAGTETERDEGWSPKRSGGPPPPGTAAPAEARADVSRGLQRSTAAAASGKAWAGAGPPKRGDTAQLETQVAKLVTASGALQVQLGRLRGALVSGQEARDVRHNTSTIMDLARMLPNDEEVQGALQTIVRRTLAHTVALATPRATDDAASGAAGATDDAPGATTDTTDTTTS